MERTAFFVFRAVVARSWESGVSGRWKRAEFRAEHSGAAERKIDSERTAEALQCMSEWGTEDVDDDEASGEGGG